MAQIAAAIDEEIGDSGCPQNLRDEVDQIALARRPDVDYEGSLRDYRGAFTDYIRRPFWPCQSLRLANSCSRRSQRIRRVVAEKFEAAADEWIKRASRCLVETVVEIEQAPRVLGKAETPTPARRGDVSDERIVPEARVRLLEVVDAFPNQLPQPVFQGVASRDFPLRPERAEPETGVHGLAAVDP
jgi:hypothetical protein